MADEAVVSTSNVVDATSTAVDSATSTVDNTGNTAQTGEVVDTSSTDPTGDLFSQVGTAIDALIPADEAIEQAAQPNADALAPFFEVSPFVKSPEHVQAAIQAADEVWKVASGQAAAPQLLESMRSANPQGFEKVIGDIIPYIEQVTGRKFTDQASTPPDPAQARLDALEARIAQEDQQRQQAAVQQQLDTAHGKATEFIASKIKGTFADGMEGRYLNTKHGLLWSKADEMNIPVANLVGELLEGKTDTVGKLLKAVQKDELAVVKQYSANIVKHHKTLADAIPAAGAVSQSSKGSIAKLPGENDVQFGARLWKQGLLDKK